MVTVTIKTADGNIYTIKNVVEIIPKEEDE